MCESLLRGTFAKAATLPEHQYNAQDIGSRRKSIAFSSILRRIDFVSLDFFGNRQFTNRTCMVRYNAHYMHARISVFCLVHEAPRLDVNLSMITKFARAANANTVKSIHEFVLFH